MYGSDAIHSMEPNEFSNLAEWLGETWEMTSSIVNKNAHSDKILEMKKIFEKSIVTSKALPKGKKLNRRDIAFKKPGDGIPAKDYRQVIGKKIDMT